MAGLTILLDIPVWMATPRHTVERFVTSSAAQFFATAMVIRYSCRWSGSPLQDVLPLRRVPAAFMGAWVLLLIGGLLLTVDLGVLLQRVWPKPESVRNIQKSLLAGEGSPVSAFVVIVLVGPVLEELLFRGVILHGFLQSYRRKTALVASAALFGVYHLNPWQAVPAFVLGLIFGSWRASTGSLWPGIVGHMLTNAVVYFARLRAGGSVKAAAPMPPASALAELGVLALILLVAGAWTLRRIRPRAPA